MIREYVGHYKFIEVACSDYVTRCKTLEERATILETALYLQRLVFNDMVREEQEEAA